jgi:hypothetical protein
VRALLVLVLFAAACPGEDKQTPACKQLLVCFLSDDAAERELAGIEDGRYKNFAAGRAEMQVAYGPNGTCFDGPDPDACNERCLCALRELCNDASARALTCAGEEGPAADRCCGLAELHEFEDGLEDVMTAGDELGQETPDELDDTCEIPIDTKLGEREQLCVGLE